MTPPVDWHELELRFRERSAMLAPESPWERWLHYGVRMFCGPVLLALAWTALSLSWPPHRLLWWSVGAFSMVQCGMLGHDLGHGQLRLRQRQRNLFGHTIVTLLTGLSFDHWSHQHALHHKFTHHAHADPDLQVDPMQLAREQRPRTALHRLLRRTQALWFPLAPAIQPFLMRIASFEHLKRQRSVLAAGCLVGHMLIWLALPTLLGLGASEALVNWVVHTALGGYYLAAVFYVNHLGLPTWTERRPHRFEIALRHTRSLSDRWWVTLIMGGLNHHAEHHIAPTTPTYRLAALRTVLRECCTDAGVAYPQFSFSEAVRDVYDGIRRLSKSCP